MYLDWREIISPQEGIKEFFGVLVIGFIAQRTIRQTPAAFADAVQNGEATFLAELLGGSGRLC
jgi:hypothetical protein